MEKNGARPDCREVDPLSLPRPLLTLDHDSSQDPVDSRLVTRTFGLEPVDHFGIHAQRNPPLAWTVPARLCAPLLVRQIQQVILNRCSQLANFPMPRPRLSPLCSLELSCHDTIVYPLPSSRYVPAGTLRQHRPTTFLFQFLKPPGEKTAHGFLPIFAGHNQGERLLVRSTSLGNPP
jgi:hypothetical protein